MNKIKQIITGAALPNIPWEEKPEGYRHIVWRYTKNPIIPRDLIPSSNSIFNSAVVPFNGEFAGVFRCDDRRRYMQIHSGRSKDGIRWEIDNESIKFICDDPEIKKFEYAYDPRVCWIEDRYYITWCNGYHGPTIGAGYTYDFKKFYQLENAFLPFNRNGVLFPRRINGKYAMLSRPSDNGHTPFGDIFYSESPDMCHWGKHRHVMSPRGRWESTKIGAGPTPIETTEGWLLIYHGVLTSCNGFQYSMGGAILDINQPWKVLHRAEPFLLTPEELYECVGDTPNVVFPCAALYDAPTGRIAIYYGGADTVTCLAFTQADELINFIKSNSSL
ncbi:MAG: glycoside hydrolase family 130 protein [Candidatus Humimicrobiaceae bacterium]|jgi:beta-1,4-mannooligosaccharide/beta-1,4-mannosyl-N-acetylglucosamine phosphorylase|nr:glycoside hydrolase family 130 protein [Actinomycetota bacterium]MDD5601279.1 glycoside hydrolase family 130 protein [Actinomycetota bacterium]MDY0027994.1 glycoside hydrolase family 130 protein [Candidatus Humimicrobiaceae bacterium]